MVRTSFTFIQVVLIYLIIGSCASERPITGGPADVTPPEILFASPENESVNIDTTVEILIKFNEQMKKSTFESAIQVWPRPSGGFEIKSGWTWLKLKFNEPLEPDETYLLTLDKGAQDLRGNGLASTYVLAFSTGNKLNSGRLSGTIHGSADIKKNGDLLLYRKFDTDLSELRQEPADYVFQPDDEGFFELPYLAVRSYMLFYHWDRNRNKLIDGDDYFARPVQAAVQARNDSIVTNHWLWPHLIPLEKLKLLGVTQLADQFLQIRGNRPVSREALTGLSLSIDNVEIPVLGAALVDEDDFAMNLDIASTLRDSSQVWIHNFQDTSGFTLDSDTLRLKTQTVFDTLALEALDVRWSSENKMKYPSESSAINIGSSLPMIFKADSAFTLVDSRIDSVRIPGSLNKNSSMEWVFTPDSLLKGGGTYAWKIESQLLHSPLHGGELDSLLKGSLKTVHPDSLGSLRIMQIGSDVLQCRLTARDLDRSFELVPGQPLLIKELPARTYSLTGYIDRDSNGRYNSGGLGPAARAESFWIFEDEIKVRARWETDLGTWTLNR